MYPFVNLRKFHNLVIELKIDYYGKVKTKETIRS